MQPASTHTDLGKFACGLEVVRCSSHSSSLLWRYNRPATAARGSTPSSTHTGLGKLACGLEVVRCSSHSSADQAATHVLRLQFCKLDRSSTSLHEVTHVITPFRHARSSYYLQTCDVLCSCCCKSLPDYASKGKEGTSGMALLAVPWALMPNLTSFAL